jgi:hypothetical protein
MRDTNEYLPAIATVSCMTALTEYIGAWVANDADRIAALVTEEWGRRHRAPLGYHRPHRHR